MSYVMPPGKYLEQLSLLRISFNDKNVIKFNVSLLMTKRLFHIHEYRD